LYNAIDAENYKLATVERLSGSILTLTDNLVNLIPFMAKYNYFGCLINN